MQNKVLLVMSMIGSFLSLTFVNMNVMATTSGSVLGASTTAGGSTALTLVVSFLVLASVGIIFALMRRRNDDT